MFGFGESNILASLVHVAFGCFSGLGIVFGDILFCEERPSDKISGFDGFDPGGFDGISTNCMHPFDSLFG